MGAFCNKHEGVREHDKRMSGRTYTVCLEQKNSGSKERKRGEGEHVVSGFENELRGSGFGDFVKLNSIVLKRC